MNLFWASPAWEDYLYWLETDGKVLSRINDLIEDIRRNPFEGIGKPEPLKHEKGGYWSRRINREHRVVYKVRDGVLYIAQCRFHYKRP